MVRQSSRTKINLQADETLYGKLDTYHIQEFLGDGVYGEVAQCITLKSKDTVAIKILRKNFSTIGKREVAALKKLKKINADKNNLIRFIEHFYHQGYFCLVFEMLDIALFDFLKQRSFRPLYVYEVRVVAQQMLVALNALKSIGWTHGDIKPDNIMLVDHQSKPFKVKLIDFGLACQASMLSPGCKNQAIGYRAPEVMLGLPLSEAIDMWALGCVMAFLYMGRHLFPIRSEYECMRILVKMQGQPEDNLLDHGVHSRELFTKENIESSLSWRLKTKEEYKLSTGRTVKPCDLDYEKFNSLDEIVPASKEDTNGTEYEDKLAFLSLLKRMLHQNYQRRIKPSEALGHRFITLKHFSEDMDSSYVESSTSTIKSCNLEELYPEHLTPFVTSSEEISLNRESWHGLFETISSKENATPAPPCVKDSDEATTVLNSENPQEMYWLVSSADFENNPQQLNSDVNKGRKRKRLKRIRNQIQRFFNRMIKVASCISPDVSLRDV